MGKVIKIDELPLETNLPDKEDIIIPIYRDDVGYVKKISFGMIVSAIKDSVTNGTDIIVEVTDKGLRFYKEESK